jgi:hypothetical protein
LCTAENYWSEKTISLAMIAEGRRVQAKQASLQDGLLVIDLAG